MAGSSTSESRPATLVPAETVVETNGASGPFELGRLAGKILLIVLHVTDIVEQESLHVSIRGSADGKNWGDKALFWFPQKFYPGLTPAALDLREHPEIKFLEARWEVNRWGRCYPRAYFKIALDVQELTPG